MIFPLRDILIPSTLLICIVSAKAVKPIPKSYIVEYNEDINTHQFIKRGLDDSFDSSFYEIEDTYSTPIFRGMSISLKNHQLSKRDEDHPVFNNLANHPSVKRIYPMYELPRPKMMAVASDNKFPYENKVSQINQMHEKLGVTGKGVLVGVLDSGVDYTHPALGGGFGPGHKIRYGKNLVDKKSDLEYGLKPLGPDDPFDPCTLNDAGHGTHVSGIIAGYAPEKNFIGIAPNATLGVWRIFGCEGGASEGTVIKAIEMAYKAGCDVINLSLGIQNGWPQTALAVAAERLANQGVTIIGVAGNQGSVGAFAQNSPSTGKHVVSVASVDNEYYPTKVFLIREIPSENYRYTPSSSTTDFPNGTLVPVFTKKQEISNACDKSGGIPKDKIYTNKILLVKRGNCTFDEKLANVKKVGAKGAIFYDPAETLDTIIVAKTDNDTLPLIGIDLESANDVLKYLKKNKKRSLTLTFPDKITIHYSKRGGKVSEFSSTGPTNELELKPNIAGIGGEVYSTVPLHIDDGWGVRTGTSMACPHVAGSAALMLEYYSKKKGAKKDSQYIIEQMQNHAKLTTYGGLPDHPLSQGAGIVQAYDAMISQIHVTPGQISFNDTSSTKNKKQTITITNGNSYDIRVKIQNRPSRSIETFPNQKSFVFTAPAFKNGSVYIDFAFEPAEETLLIKSGTSLKVNVTVLLPDPKKTKYHHQMYGGFLSVNDAKTTTSLATLPYFGVLGRMKDIPLFDKGYPYLASSDNIELPIKNTKKPYVYNSKKSHSKPIIVVKLLTASPLMHMLVYNHKTNKLLGYMSNGPWTYNQRNTVDDGMTISTLKWSGKVVSKPEEHSNENLTKIPKGQYHILLRALRHFGDPNNPKDWDEWKSGPIDIHD